MALSGSLNTSKYNGEWGYTFSWTASQSVSNNTSTVKWTLKATGSGQGWIAERTVNVKINGSTKWSKSDRVERYIGDTVATGTFTVNHNSAGEGSFTAYVEGALYTSGISVTSSTKTFTLNTIARATTPSLSDSDVTMGDSITISCPRASSSFTHTLTYKFGSASGTIGTGVATSKSWTVPTSLATQIPNATKGSGTITCKTYKGSTLIGSKSVTFKASVPSNVVPTISSVTLSDPMGYASTYGKYVQKKSKVKVQVASAGASGSTIKTTSITCLGTTTTSNPFTSNVISASGTQTVTVKVTDSRGRTATTSVTFSIATYSTPVASSLSASRCNQDGTANEEGSYMKITYAGSIMNINSAGVNAKSFVVKYKKQDATSWTTGASHTNAYSVSSSLIVSADTESEYDITFVVTDSFASASRTTELSTAFTLLDFNASGKGMAVGKVSTDNNFDVNLPSVFQNNVSVNGYITGAYNGTNQLRLNRGGTGYFNINVNTDRVNLYSDRSFVQSQQPIYAPSFRVSNHDSNIGTRYSDSESSATQSLTNNAWTKSTKVSLTLPAGSYVICGRVSFSSSSGGRRGLQIIYGSSDSALGDSTILMDGGSANMSLTAQCSTVVEISSSTTFTLNMYQNSGSQINATVQVITAMRIA